MNSLTKNIISKICAVLMVIALTISDFLFVGASIVSYAIDVAKTNSSNVEFSAYFLNSNGEKVEKIEEDINNKEQYLYVDVSVKNEGYFTGVILFENNNFNIKEEILSDYISEIKENKITLNQINAGSTVTLKLAIEAINKSIITKSTLNSVTDVVLNGKYINSKNVEKDKYVDIKGTTKIEVNWKSSESIQAELESTVLTNAVYQNSEEAHRVVQLLVNSKVNDNCYPVKNTQIKLSVPENVKNIKVQSISNEATNGEIKFDETNYIYNKENRELIINVLNENENNISWNKNCKDMFDITYLFDKDEDVSNKEITINSTLQTYDDKVLTATNNVRIEQELDGILSASINSVESYIYKGKLYTGEEKEYTTISKVNFGFLNIIDNVSIKENEAKFISENQEIPANIVYKQTKINKQELQSLFGEDGFITVKDENGAILANINNNSEADENGNIVVNYAQSVKNIEIVTSKPVSIGELKIENTKTILNSDYSREKINTLTAVKESITTKYNNQEEMQNETTIELKNTTSKAILDVSTNSLSTIDKNENVKITAVLANNGEDKDLYQNPTVKITLPEQVKGISAKCKLLYANGLELQNAKIQTENGKNVIQINLSGKQTTYNTETVEGTTIVIYANLELDKLAVRSNEEILLNYTNEIATSFEDNAEEKSPVDIIATEGIITTNSISEYGVETIGDKGTQKVTLNVSEQEKNATVNISAINNEGANIKNVKILGRFPTSTNLNAKLTSGINITNNGDSAKVYYSNNENATADLKDTANGWTETRDSSTSKSYLIEIEQINAKEKFEANYSLNIPGDLSYNLEASEGYKVIYTNDITLAEKEANATTLNLTTGAGPELDVSVKATVGNDTVGEGKDDNTPGADADITAGEMVKYQVSLTNSGTEKANNVQVQEIVPEGAVAMEYIPGAITEDGANGLGATTPSQFVELEETTITKTIESIEVGETKTIDLYLRPTKSGTISNKIVTNYHNRTVQKFVTNNVKNSNIKVDFRAEDFSGDEEKLVIGEEYKYCVTINNTAENTINNLKVDFLTNQNLEVTKIEYYDSSKINSEDYDGEIIENKNSIVLPKLENSQDVIVTVKVKNGSKEINMGEILATITENNNIVRTNKISKNIVLVDVSMSLRANNSGENVELGQEINYVINVSNVQNGVDLDDIVVDSYIGNNLNINSVEIEGTPVSEENYTVDIDDETERQLIALNTELKAGESKTILVKTKVDEEVESEEDTQIITNADVKLAGQVLASTDKIVHLLGATAKDEKTEGNDPYPNSDTIDGTPANKTPEAQEDEDPKQPTSDSEKPAETVKDSVKTYSISGTAWLDSNENGKRDSSETKLSNIQVILVDANTNSIAVNSDNAQIIGTTDKDGFYSLNKIKAGKYLAIFKYDTNKYVLTRYQVDGIEETKNSDAETANITLNGENQKVAITDTLDITNSSKENIDIGLVEAKTFDLELTKTISKVTVSNDSGTEALNYNDADLAKVEIKAKYLKGTTVVIEYKIKVKNNGEVAGYAKNIVDYKPADLSFNSSLNKDWYQSGDYIYSSSLANTKIEAGETKELTLILTKTMTESNTGLVNNTAEISSDYNVLSIKDTDSTPGNKQSNEDDMGKANVIISVKTGAAVSYIALTLSMIVIISAGAYIVTKKISKQHIQL